MEAWTFVNGTKISIPLDHYDALKYKWHAGTALCKWDPSVDIEEEMHRENEIRDWCRKTFDQNTYVMFYDSVWFYRESDATLCKLKWG